MALKLLFFCFKITNIAQGLGAPPPDPRSQSLYLYIFSDYARPVTRLNCTSFFSTGPKSGKFCAKKKLLVQPCGQNSGCVSSSIHCCRKVFQAIMGRRGNKLHKKRSGLIVFLDMNAELFKLSILKAVQNLKINFYMQKFSLF